MLAHCPRAIAVGWKELPYEYTRTTAMVSELPGGLIRFAPGPGRLDLKFHKHAWSGSIEIEMSGNTLRHDLYAEEPQPLVTVSIDVLDEDLITLRSLPHESEGAQGDEVWFVGASWSVRPSWFPIPDSLPSSTVAGIEQRIELQDAQLIREFYCSDDPLDIFDAYAFLDRQRVHCCRRWFGQSKQRIGGFRDSRVVVRGIDLDYGDDPRVFVHQGRLSVLSATYSPTHGFRNHLIVFNSTDRWSRYFLMPPLGLNPGKNWSPFEDRSGRLNVIHSFSPLVILQEIRRERGIILLEARTASGVPLEEGPEEFPAHRGGTNGLPCGPLIFGIGHTTRLAADCSGAPVYHPHCLFPNSQQLIHRPFGWLLDPDSLAVQLFDISHTWDQHFWIIDPTSLIWNADEECFEIFTTEVERNFCDPTSRGRTMSYKLARNRILEIAKKAFPQLPIGKRVPFG